METSRDKTGRRESGDVGRPAITRWVKAEGTMYLEREKTKAWTCTSRCMEECSSFLIARYEASRNSGNRFLHKRACRLNLFIGYLRSHA